MAARERGKVLDIGFLLPVVGGVQQREFCSLRCCEIPRVFLNAG
jgi:hypothetical protein